MASESEKGAKTPEQIEKRRAQIRASVAKHRAEKTKRGICPACLKREAKPGGVTCKPCDDKSVQADRAAGWRKRPVRIVDARIVEMRRNGAKISEILQEPLVVEYGANRTYILRVLKAKGV